ncbi:phosphatidylserine decarboxylase proenzyme 3-like [Populus alba x Populus x berolinensis]|nr:phosphatidylserine decarboxylase proenzyme 3-like [Populus alba x Populus x berolinensis]
MVELDDLVNYAYKLGFRTWVKTLDADKDGKINKDELADAVRGNGGWFAGWKGKSGVKAADANRNGVIDDSEIDNLAAFAQKHLGIIII